MKKDEPVVCHRHERLRVPARAAAQLGVSVPAGAAPDQRVRRLQTGAQLFPHGPELQQDSRGGRPQLPAQLQLSQQLLPAAAERGLKQQCVQERVSLWLAQQHCGWPELPDGPFLRPLSLLGAQEAQQEASTQLPMPPLLQQGPLYQRLPSGQAQGRGPDAVPGEEEVFRGVQVSQV